MRKFLSSLFVLLIVSCATQPSPAASAPTGTAAPAPTAVARPAQSMSTEWRPLDPAVLCGEVKDPALCASLLDLVNKDQIVRRKWLADRENKDVQAEVKRVDEENMAAVAKIIDEHGWPRVAQVGKRAAGGAWTIIQHAPIDTIRKYLEVMTAAVEKGDLDGGLLATTVDRVRVADGKPQVYGTQFHEVNGEMVPLPIEDEANVDARRAKVGLQPLAEYTTALRQMYKKKS